MRREQAAGSAALVAWSAAVACALVLVAAAVLLAAPLGRLLYPPPTLQLLPNDTGTLAPEPVESTRYLLALCAVALLVAATIAIADGRVRVPLPGRRTVVVAQVLLVALVTICLVVQHAPRWTIGYFTVRSLAVAAAIAAAVTLLARGGRASRLAARLPRSRAWRVSLWLVALVATAVWILPAINTERSIAWAPLSHDTAFHFDETLAVVNGLTPLVDFNAQYASLFPYAIALALVAFGKTLLVFTIAVCALTVVALLAVYGAIRRASPHPLVALLLFLPFMATSLFDPFGYGFIRLTPGTYFPMLPFRYGAPYLLAWLVARELDTRGRHPRTWLLFSAAGVAVLNNFEFGVAALGATVAALLCTTSDWRPRPLGRLAGGAALGLGGALAAYSAFALARAGALPDLARMPQFARLYGVAGYSVAPMPGIIGLPLAIFLTYAGAIALATVRALDRAPNRVLTGMLAWSGVFGLGSATYWVARSDGILLSMTFSAWALTLVMLTLAVLERLPHTPVLHVGPAALAVLFGIGLATCSLAQAPFPWDEVDRIQTRPARAPAAPVPWARPPSRAPEVRRFVGSISAGPERFVLRRGAPIALFATTGHRIADAYGVVNVVPFTGPESMHTIDQLGEALDALRRAGGNTVLLPRDLVEGLHEALEQRGFRLLTADGVRTSPIGGAEVAVQPLTVTGLTKWVDMTRPRAPWLD